MASEQTKSPAEQPAQPAPVPTYPPPYPGAAYNGPPYNGAHFAPLPPGYPPYYAYAPMPDPNHDPNAPNGAPPPVPYLMAFAPPPPGMVYAYAPPMSQGQVPYSYPPPPPVQAAPAGPPPPRPKRKQVKMACTNCAGACKRCDDNRPCERCVKYGVSETCVDGVRKERKKGIKRGPYKRKAKASNGDVSYPEELSPADTPAEPTTSAESGSAQPAPGAYAPPPEGFYPYYYPHPYLAPPPEAQANGENTTNGNGHAVPHPPYYPLHPAVYPYPPYTHPPPLAYAAPPHAIMAPPPNNSATPETNGRPAEDSPTKGKKRSRKTNEESTRAKKTKEFHVDPGNNSTNGNATSNVSLNGSVPGGGREISSTHGQPVNGNAHGDAADSPA